MTKNVRAFGQNFKVGEDFDASVFSSEYMASPNQYGGDVDSRKTVTRMDMLNQARKRSQNQIRQSTGAMIANPNNNDAASQFSYAARSKVIYQRGMQKKNSHIQQKLNQQRQSSSNDIGPYTGMNEALTQSQGLNRVNVQRFNENPNDYQKEGPKSQLKSVFSQRNVQTQS
mmetsp:Transcript_8555/g.14432  ORF Transcript_8555/g.14432 Transcript_8555/m.14432 type:complete len:171 (-) Transcript_8555:673-1185(-)